MTIRRPDGSWIFHFVNVVDDIEMKISHVIRGEDHLSNTPKHIELYRALGAEPPRFAHIPLILNKDGSKMSKRDLGASLNTYIEQGFLPEAVCNYLCLLGWSPKDDREKIDLEEVVRLFELEKVNRKNAPFDLEKCTWLNGEYTHALRGERFYELARAGARPRRHRSRAVFRRLHPRRARHLRRQIQNLRRAAALCRLLFPRRFSLQRRERRETFHRRKQAAPASGARCLCELRTLRRRQSRDDAQGHRLQHWASRSASSSIRPGSPSPAATPAPVSTISSKSSAARRCWRASSVACALFRATPERRDRRVRS